MHSADEVIFVLQAVLGLGPLAVYFLSLGLVNSQVRPRLISARSDFLVLSLALIPLCAIVAFSLIEAAMFLLAGAWLVGFAALWVALLPRVDSGWVIYNIDPERCLTLLRRACRGQCGRDAIDEEGQQITLRDGETGEAVLVARIEPLPWLRNVTLRLEAGGGCEQAEAIRFEVLKSLEAELEAESMLPSATGMGLVMVGMTLLGLPMWCVVRHADAIADVVRQLFLA